MEKRVCQRAMEYEPPMSGVRAAEDLQLWLLNGGRAGAAFVDAAQRVVSKGGLLYHATPHVVLSHHLVAPLRIALTPDAAPRIGEAVDSLRLVLVGAGALLDAPSAVGALSELVGAIADIADHLGAPLVAALPQARYVDLRFSTPLSSAADATLLAGAAEQLAQARGLSARVLCFDPAAGVVHLGRGEGYNKTA